MYRQDSTHNCVRAGGDDAGGTLRVDAEIEGEKSAGLAEKGQQTESGLDKLHMSGECYP